ncbi:MAG: hypothetical protein ACK5JT_08930, partial [Hyphomicrobiaceae bacterium]
QSKGGGDIVRGRHGEDTIRREGTASQHVESYDHDFLEASFATSSGDIASRFATCSWAAEWAPELAFRATDHYPRFARVDSPNCLIMIGGDPDRPQDWLYGDLFDISAPGIELHVMGYHRFQLLRWRTGRAITDGNLAKRQ